jgi:hypothetical protein
VTIPDQPIEDSVAISVGAVQYIRRLHLKETHAQDWIPHLGPPWGTSIVSIVKTSSHKKSIY